MNTKTTLSITDARKKIFDIAEEVQRPGKYYTLTEQGKPKAVIMSSDDFESWQETLDILQQFPDLPKDIAKVDADVKSGAYKKYITLGELLAKDGFVLKEKSKKKYEVSNKVGTKSAKRTGKTTGSI
jgi:prevent-host-death family protein